MSLIKVISLFVVYLFGVLHTVTSQCSVNIRNDIPIRDPVYIRNTGAGYHIWAPDGPALISAAGASHLVTCSGSGNSLTVSGAVSNTAVCISGTNFAVGGTTTPSGSLQCANTITGDTMNSGTGCTGGGTILYIGFQTVTHGFARYIDSCYNMATGSVMYTRHPLPGRAINHAVIESSRPSFKTAGTAPHVSPAVSFTQASQMTRLTGLLGSAAQAALFLTTSSFLSRGHLAPDADGIFRSWQFTTYFYTNAAPQWQVFNAGNWLRVENAARAKAGNSQQDLVVYTGTHGILTLPHVGGHQVEITLEAGGNIEVPKWFWKVIRSAASNAAIVLVGLNNPHVSSLPANEMLCTDICASTGWSQPQFSNFAQGYTYCCEVNAFRAAVPRVPAEATAPNVLHF